MKTIFDKIVGFFHKLKSDYEAKDAEYAASDGNIDEFNFSEFSKR